VILGVDSVADFEELHSGKHNDEVQFYAFDALSLDGHDLQIRIRRLGVETSREPISCRLLAGQTVRIKQTDERIWLASFMDYGLGYFHDGICRLEPSLVGGDGFEPPTSCV
jgi:hypothetical protein